MALLLKAFDFTAIRSDGYKTAQKMPNDALIDPC
jgi:hypothetical protein